MSIGVCGELLGDGPVLRLAVKIYPIFRVDGFLHLALEACVLPSMGSCKLVVQDKGLSNINVSVLTECSLGMWRCGGAHPLCIVVCGILGSSQLVQIFANF